MCLIGVKVCKIRAFLQQMIALINGNMQSILYSSPARSTSRLTTLYIIKSTPPPKKKILFVYCCLLPAFNPTFRASTQCHALVGMLRMGHDLSSLSK